MHRPYPFTVNERSSGESSVGEWSGWVGEVQGASKRVSEWAIEDGEPKKTVTERRRWVSERQREAEVRLRWGCDWERVSEKRRERVRVSESAEWLCERSLKIWKIPIENRLLESRGPCGPTSSDAGGDNYHVDDPSAPDGVYVELEFQKLEFYVDATWQRATSNHRNRASKSRGMSAELDPLRLEMLLNYIVSKPGQLTI